MAKTKKVKEDNSDTSLQEKKTRKPREKKEIEKSIENVNVNLDTTIYGDEIEKNVLPFPQSDLQTQTKNIIKEYDINVNRLPQNIVDSINDFIQIFSQFVSNPNQFNLIGTIMDKDLISSNLLKSWVEDKKENLLKLKETKKPEQPKEIPAHLQNALDSAKNETNIPATNNDNVVFPRQPVSTYQHNIAPPIQQENNLFTNVFPTGENKTIHYEMLSKAFPQIRANDTAQQNWMGQVQVPNQNEVVIDRDKMFADYVNSVTSSIKNTFQNIHWGYVPLDTLKNLINNCDKLYKYEIVNNGDNSFINITFNGKTIKTDSFSIK